MMFDTADLLGFGRRSLRVDGIVYAWAGKNAISNGKSGAFPRASICASIEILCTSLLTIDTIPSIIQAHICLLCMYIYVFPLWIFDVDQTFFSWLCPFLRSLLCDNGATSKITTPATLPPPAEGRSSRIGVISCGGNDGVLLTIAKNIIA